MVLETEVEALEQKRSELREEKWEAEQQSTNLKSLPGVDHVEGEIQAIHESQQRIRAQRDRFYLLSEIIREADSRYRADHQPPVFREASRFISAITNNRYSGLSVDAASQQTQLLVRHPQDISPQPLMPETSRGTREQIYLALRLAFTDHIGGDAALPLVLDELFVNWDPKRTQQGFEVLREASRKRQGFFLTCHPETATLAEDRLGTDCRRPAAGAARRRP